MKADIDLNNPAQHAFVITPSNATPLAHETRGIYVGVSGNLNVTLTDGYGVTFVNIAAGVIHPICAKYVAAVGTTATNIVGVW